MNKQIVFLISLLFAVYGCTDPAVENIRGLEDTYKDPNFAQGLVINGYARIPTNSWSFNEMATDDAVSSNVSNTYLKVATGQWRPIGNPFDQWRNSKAAIQYLNLYLEVADNVTYATSTEAVNEMFRDRNIGEAYGLRALFMYYLLRNHAGKVNGELLGVPIVNEPESVDSDFNVSRPAFELCMQQIYSDLDMAIDLLPLDYFDIADESLIPVKYASLNPTVVDYNRAFGDDSKLLFSGRIGKAIKAQAALLAASPAFTGNTTTWEDAANYAADVIDDNNGVAGVAQDGFSWWTNTGAAAGGNNPAEILWRTSMGGNSSNLEADNFPPTLYGSGLVNPTQNLVDAFPMANGYPIDDPNSGYDPTDPYAGRDPRLSQTVIYNGSTAGVNNTAIITAGDGTTNDALNKVETSTRTGYYLKKLLRQDVNLTPGTVSGQPHLQPRIRYTEIYLIYAEAANEAWGPTNSGGNAYSAYDVIKAIRERAGITGGDVYLESIKNDKNEMRKLIRNERRIELSFEGFRFWDLRRWNEDLTETAEGVNITSNTFNMINVENRVYEPYMIYGPIPQSEILKYDALQQNDEW